MSKTHTTINARYCIKNHWKCVCWVPHISFTVAMQSWSGESQVQYNLFVYSNPTQQHRHHRQPFLLVSVIGEDKIFVSTFPAKPSKGTVRNCTLKPPSCDLIFVSLETLLTNLGWRPTGTDTGTGGSLYPAYYTTLYYSLLTLCCPGITGWTQRVWSLYLSPKRVVSLYQGLNQVR